MKLKLSKGEKYTLKNPLHLRTSFSAGTIPVGEEIEIQQVDERNRNYLVDNVWVHYSSVEKAVGV